MLALIALGIALIAAGVALIAISVVMRMSHQIDSFEDRYTVDFFNKLSEGIQKDEIEKRRGKSFR